MTESKLQEAFDMLDHGNRWVKNSWFSEDGTCMAGALRLAHNVEYHGVSAYLRDVGRLADVIVPPVRDFRFVGEKAITSFNDASATTWEDVALAFKKAIADADDD